MWIKASCVLGLYIVEDYGSKQIETERVNLKEAGAKGHVILTQRKTKQMGYSVEFGPVRRKSVYIHYEIRVMCCIILLYACVFMNFNTCGIS